MSDHTLDQVIHEYQILRAFLIDFLSQQTALSPPVQKVIHSFLDQGIRKSSRKLLVKNGANVAIANDGEEAIQKGLSEHSDIIEYSPQPSPMFHHSTFCKS